MSAWTKEPEVGKCYYVVTSLNKLPTFLGKLNKVDRAWMGSGHVPREYTFQDEKRLY